VKLAYVSADNRILVADADATQRAEIRKLGLLSWDAGQRWYEGEATVPLIDSLSAMCRLPDALTQLRSELCTVQGRIEALRKQTPAKPITEYPVHATLFDHQIRGANMALVALGLDREDAARRGGFGLLMEMGCGKSLAAIAVMGVAAQRGARRILVVAPTSVCAVWTDELSKFAAFDYNAAELVGTMRQRVSALTVLQSSGAGRLQVAIINYESAWRPGIGDALLAWRPDMVIADESQRIKTHDAAQSKGLHRLGDVARYRLILSGTPVTNSAIDLWSQYRFMDQAIFGRSYWAFRSRYAVMGGYENKKIVDYRHVDELVRREYSRAYRVTKAQCLDLPEQTFVRRVVALEPAAQAMYNTLKRESYAELERGDVVASTALTRLLRLQQLAGGFLSPDGQAASEQVSTAKLAALEDILIDHVEATGRKLVIFARFRAEIAAIHSLLDKHRITHSVLTGDTPMQERGQMVAVFQSSSDMKVFVAQIDTAGLGITLTAADTCVYYSTNYNYAAYEQSLARIHRIGQRNTCTYIHLVAAHTVDEAILKALSAKKDLAKTIVDNWREYLA
jgi:SNF2 family DNA or RNA helicase